MKTMNSFIKSAIVLFTLSFMQIIITMLSREAYLNDYANCMYAIAGSQFGTGLICLIKGINRNK